VSKSFEVINARTVKEASHLLSRYEKEARLIAGGTDLLLKIKDGVIDLKYLINILTIPHLNKIELDDQGTLRLGALATIQSIADSAIAKDRFPVIAEASEQLGSAQIRNVATLGGNLCNASPAADMAPPLIVLGAKAKIIGDKGEKTCLVEDIFLRPSETTLSHEELLIHIEVPPLPDQSGAVYLKFGPRRAMDIAFVGVAIFIQLDSQRRSFEEVRIALGAVAPIPVRARKAEEFLKGKNLKESLNQKVGYLASQEAEPISDLRGSASYRKEIVRILTIRGLQLAVTRIGVYLP
jgi:carbon-monoxide dehydrogenase medium subunit